MNGFVDEYFLVINYLIDKYWCKLKRRDKCFDFGGMLKNIV